MALENIFPPVPSEVIMGFGGIAVAHGEMAFWPLLLAGTIGSVIGNYCWYLAGGRLGFLRLKPLIGRRGPLLTTGWGDMEQSGRAAWRVRGGREVWVSGVDVTVKKNS